MFEKLRSDWNRASVRHLRSKDGKERIGTHSRGASIRCVSILLIPCLGSVAYRTRGEGSLAILNDMPPYATIW